MYVQGLEYMYLYLLLILLPLDLVEKEVCNGLGTVFVSVLELQIVSRIILLDSVLGVSFVWVAPLSH